MPATKNPYFKNLRISTYLLIIFFSVLAAYSYRIYHLRRDGLFACSAEEYSGHNFLAYCNGQGYGEYEHGAFWFDLEPSAQAMAKSANVMFLGDSHMQYGFSSEHIKSWFSSISATYYLLGFLYVENSVFARALLNKLAPQAKVYVINVDEFFVQDETPPAKTVMHDRTARSRYEEKHLLQRAHEFVCKRITWFCGDQYTVFRSRETGGYTATGLSNFHAAPVAFDSVIDQDRIEKYIAVGRSFLSILPVKPECILFTLVPSAETNLKIAEGVATGLAKALIAPNLEGLVTFDGSHLDRPSAERWSEAFLQLAGPKIRNCLGQEKAPNS